MQSRFNKVTGWCYWNRTPKLAVYSIILTFYSENSLCRRYESFFFWSLDASLVFDREYCCEVLQNLLFTGDQKNSYFRSSEKKNAQGKQAAKASKPTARACNFTWNKVFIILILSVSQINLSVFTTCFTNEV